MAKVELKQPIVDEIKGVLDGAKGAVIVDYRGLTVEQDTRLRKQLREAGVIYKVYKLSLIHISRPAPEKFAGGLRGGAPAGGARIGDFGG